MSVNLSQMNTAWSRKMKLKRLAWEIVQAVLFRPTPKLKFWGWRAWLLRCFGAKLGPGVRILGSVKVLMPWNLECGENAVIGANTDVYNFAPIKIGANAMVSQRTFLCTGSHDFRDPALPLIFEPITIGDQAWVAAECFVGPGRTIGEGAVIAARSVVIHDMPAWMICAGHPCKPIKPRELNSHSKLAELTYE